MYSISYEIKPIFAPSINICKDFARIELLCETYLGRNHNDWYRSSCEDYYIKCRNDKNSFMFIAVADKEVIGFTNGGLKNNNIFLDNFYVNPMYQGFGVGKDLLQTTENAVGIIKPDLYLTPLSTAVSFYQQQKYNYVPGGNNLMRKKLSNTINGVVPVFEWCDELKAKLNVKTDSDLLKTYKHQPMFVYVGKNKLIDGIAVRLSNGEQYIKLDEKQKSVMKWRKLELEWALYKCK